MKGNTENRGLKGPLGSAVALEKTATLREQGDTQERERECLV